MADIAPTSKSRTRADLVKDIASAMDSTRGKGTKKDSGVSSKSAGAEQVGSVLNSAHQYHT
jgi:hypothetical protein